MSKEKFETAILFKKIFVQDMEIFIPARILLGKTNEKMSMFEDYTTNIMYINSDLARFTDLVESFNLIVSLKELKKVYKNNNLKKLFEAYFEDIKKNIYFYDEDDLTLNVMPQKMFYLKYCIKVDYVDLNLVNESMQKFIDGEIQNIDEIYDIVYGKNDEEKQEDDKLAVSNLQEMNFFEEIKISEVCSEIQKSIISQDEAIKKIVTAIYRNNIFENPKMKSNIFIYGPTGVGKTAIVKLFARHFKLPVSVEDMTRYTIAGYKGADIDDILLKLYHNANDNIEEAEKSILILDEIDKKAAGNDGQSSIATNGVLTSLLKIIEGDVFDIYVGNGKTINFDTSKLTVIVCGAFSDLYETKKNKTVGFGARDEKETSKIEMKDFVNYGMPIEFMGRFDTIIRMNELTKEDYVKILKTSDLSPIKIYEEALEKLGINLKAKEKLYDLIAEKTMEYNTGARALKVVTDEIFENILYGIFDNPKKKYEITIDENILKDKNSFKLTKKQEN